MSSNVVETPVVNNIEVVTKAEETPRQNQAETTPKDSTSQAATPRVEAEKTAAAENQTVQPTKQEEKKVLGLAELTTLTNRVDEILLRSSSATLVSQRNLSSSLDVSYLSSAHKTVTVETTKTSANPLYTSHIHTVASPTYSLLSHRSDVDLLRSIQNYQVKTVHGVESLRSVPVQYHHVEEVRSATYPSYSYNQQQVGYDRQKLDQIIARIQGNTPRTYTHTLEVVKNHSAPVDYRFHQTSETKKSSRPQKESSFKYVEADEDSFIQEAKSAQTQKYEDQVEVESPAKKRSINKRQEILSAKKQNPAHREVYSPSPKKDAPVEERQKQSPYVAEQDKNEEKNDLIMLSKKPSLRNSYYFGNEQRRGGSTLLQDGRHRE